jgi:hypothetical protein
MTKQLVTYTFSNGTKETQTIETDSPKEFFAKVLEIGEKLDLQLIHLSLVEIVRVETTFTFGKDTLITE